MELLNTSSVAKLLNVSGSVLKKWHDGGDYMAHKLSPGGLRLYDANLMKAAAQISSCYELKTRSKLEVLSVLKRPKCVALFGSLIGVDPDIRTQRRLILGYCLTHDHLPSFDFPKFPENPREIMRRLDELGSRTIIISSLCYFSREQLLTVLSIAHKYNITLVTVNDKSMSENYFGIDYSYVEQLAQA